MSDDDGCGPDHLVCFVDAEDDLTFVWPSGDYVSQLALEFLSARMAVGEEPASC